MQYAYQLVYRNNEEARQAYTKHFNAKAKARRFEVGDEVLASFPINQHIPNKKLASIWRGPFSIIEICENNIVLIKASPRHKVIKIHINRIRLFNSLIDVVTTPAEDTIITTNTNITPTVSHNDDDDDDIYDTVDPILPEQPIEQPIEQPPVSPLVLQRREGNWQINRDQRTNQPEAPLTPLDQLATELFRHTRSRGPVADLQPIPRRPAEYKPAPKRK